MYYVCLMYMFMLLYSPNSRAKAQSAEFRQKKTGNINIEKKGKKKCDLKIIEDDVMEKETNASHMSRHV